MTRCTLIFALLVCIFLARPAVAIVAGQAPSDDDKRFDAVAAFGPRHWMRAGTKERPDLEHNWTGAAMLIAPDTIITARHLLDGNKNPKPYTYAVRFRRNPDGSIGSKEKGWQSFHQADIVKWILHPKTDLALGILDKPVKHITPLPILTDTAPFEKREAFLAGWGSESRWQGDHGPRISLKVGYGNTVTRRENARSISINAFTTEHRERRKNPETGKPVFGRYITGDIGVPNMHDSGGAVLLEDEDGLLYLAGVITTYRGAVSLGHFLDEPGFDVPMMDKVQIEQLRLKAQSAELRPALKSYFAAPRSQQAAGSDQPWANAPPLDASEAAAWRELLGQIMREAAASSVAAADFQNRRVVTADLTVGYEVEYQGVKPAKGWPVIISLHDGGSTKRVADLAYANQKRRYKTDAMMIYPRAPEAGGDVWTSTTLPLLFQQLTNDLLLHGDVDADRIYLHGVGMGGEAAMRIGAAMSDRVAGVAVAGVVLPEEADAPEQWKSTSLQLHIGTAFKKHDAYEKARLFTERADALRGEAGGQREADVQVAYTVELVEHIGRGKLVNDAPALDWLLKQRRTVLPKRLIWLPTGPADQTHHWLALEPTAEPPSTDARIEAQVDGDVVNVKLEGVDSVILCLDDRLIDLSKPVKITVNGQAIEHDALHRTLANMIDALAHRADATFAYPVRLRIGK